MIDKTNIDPNALHFYRLLKEAGFSAYFVGGSVRDLLLGKHPKDFDIATNATPHQIKRVIPQGRIIGRRFRHVILERDMGRYEIVTFRGPIPAQAETPEDETNPDSPEEISPEAAADQERRFPDLNQFGTAQQDAIRRDFTINALFYDPDADELVDYVEGKLDIDKKIIRTIGDAKLRMAEDPIRILRAIRHKMKLGLEYDPYLLEAMQEKAPLLEETSKDRIREEFLKVCNDRSLVSFLEEIKRIGIQHYVMPWFDDLDEASWAQGVRIWEQFSKMEAPERVSPDMGLALMMTPLIDALVLTPYKATLSEGEKNYLPDMKYFLSCESLRDYFLRNLRISRAQTDYIVRALFYWSRMTGLWVENGPPRRVVGRLFQHPPALLAARMARLLLALDGKEMPPWLKDLAEFDPRVRRDERDHRDNRDANRGPRENNREPHRNRPQHEARPQSQDGADQDMDHDDEEIPAAPQRLAPPEIPMVWNGPLHAPVLRPTFSEELPNRWARKNQTICAYRPSGIPNQPTDYAMLKSHLVSNYKPELETTSTRDDNHDPRRGGGRNRNRRDRNDRNDRPDRGEHRNDRGERNPEREQSAKPREERAPMPNRPQEEVDEDSYGNILRPGEGPSHLAGAEPNYLPADDLDEDEDNIGNRLDAPPTSGHVGINGEGVLGANNRAPGFNRHHSGGHRGPGHGGGAGGGQGGGGGRNNNRRRRSGKRGGGGGGGGPNRPFRGGGGGGSNAGSAQS